jgi:hypothetical protein
MRNPPECQLAVLLICIIPFAFPPHNVAVTGVVCLDAQGVDRIFRPAAEHWVQFVFKCSGLLARQIVGHKMLEIE